MESSVLPPLALISLLAQGAPRVALPDGRFAERARGLALGELDGLLDQIAEDPELWSSYRSVAGTIARSSLAHLQVHEILRSKHVVLRRPRGVPPHLVWRAMSSATAAAGMLPAGERLLGDAMGRVLLIASPAFCPTIYSFARGLERSTKRGFAAAMVLAASDPEANPRQHERLLGAYLNGIESAVLLMKLDRPWGQLVDILLLQAQASWDDWEPLDVQDELVAISEAEE